MQTLAEDRTPPPKGRPSPVRHFLPPAGGGGRPDRRSDRARRRTQGAGMDRPVENPQPVDAAVTPRFGAIPTFMRLPYITDPTRVDIALVGVPRSEEHTSELQSLMRIPSAVFC